MKIVFNQTSVLKEFVSVFGHNVCDDDRFECFMADFVKYSSELSDLEFEDLQMKSGINVIEFGSIDMMKIDNCFKKNEEYFSINDVCSFYLASKLEATVLYVSDIAQICADYEHVSTISIEELKLKILVPK